LACRNVALTNDNAAQWRQQLDRIDTALNQSLDILAPYMRERLAERRQLDLEADPRGGRT